MEESAAASAAANPSPSPRIRTAPVRVVASIFPGPGGGPFQVAARHDAPDSSSSVVSFTPILNASEAASAGAMTPRKNHEYRLDCCYLNDDSYTRIFHSEVKPLLDDIFYCHGHSNACVLACGTTAKSRLIMGSRDNPGLLAMAMAQILHHAKPIGAAVSVSSFQVLQDNHVFDLLEPKDNEVLVLEDADGRTHLKGLSKVDVKSIEEFVDLSCCTTDSLKHPIKASSHLQAREGHQGFIIYISRFDQQGRECAVAKMIFLELAGYVDPKHNYGGGLALPNSNKSLYAVMNVVQALNSNKSFIPYRQSKLTRISQDSLSKTNGAVLIACLDEVSGPDAFCTLSLASRSSHMVNGHNLSLGVSSSKSNVNLSTSANNFSRSLLSSIHQPSSALEKHGRPRLINSAVKSSRTPTANKRSEAIIHSSKKTLNSVSTSINMKHLGARSIMSGRCPSANSPKEDSIVVVPTTVRKAKEIPSSQVMEIQEPSPVKGCDETENVMDVVSSKMPEVVSCSMKELMLSGMQEKNHPSSDLHAENSRTQLNMAYSSDEADKIVEKTPVNATRSSPKLSDRLKEISNSLKLLSTRPLSITKQKIDMIDAEPFNTDVVEPKTPPIQYKVWHTEHPQESLKACNTGIQKSLVQECLTFLNSANKEQLKSLKGIGEKRANYIIELREESPEVFKEVDDLRSIIGMNKKEIKNMMAGMIMDS